MPTESSKKRGLPEPHAQQLADNPIYESAVCAIQCHVIAPTPRVKGPSFLLCIPSDAPENVKTDVLSSTMITSDLGEDVGLPELNKTTPEGEVIEALKTYIENTDAEGSNNPTQYANLALAKELLRRMDLLRTDVVDLFNNVESVRNEIIQGETFKTMNPDFKDQGIDYKLNTVIQLAQSLFRPLTNEAIRDSRISNLSSIKAEFPKKIISECSAQFRALDDQINEEYKRNQQRQSKLAQEKENSDQVKILREKITKELENYASSPITSFKIHSKSRTESSKVNRALAKNLAFKIKNSEPPLFDILRPEYIILSRNIEINKLPPDNSVNHEMTSKKLQAILNKARADLAQTFEGKKASILQALEAYVCDAPKRTFSFFKEERTQSRMYNMKLANILITQLKTASEPATIADMFSSDEIQTVRNAFIDADYHRGIHSTQLNKALELAQKLFPVLEHPENTGLSSKNLVNSH